MRRKAAAPEDSLQHVPSGAFPGSVQGAEVEDKMKDLNSLIFGSTWRCNAEKPPPEGVTGMGMTTYWFDKCLSPLFDVDEGADDQLLGCGAWQEDHGDWVRVQGVVDSGACKPVAPPHMAPGFPVRSSEASRAGKTYSSASGHPLHNLGEQLLAAVTDGGVETEVLFQLADVSCPLISVSQICDHGNRVIFGRGGGVILNLETGEEVPFQRQGGVYALGLWMRRGDPKIAVESVKAAEARAAAAKKGQAAPFGRR